MKSPQQWKTLLESINFPNLNKSDNEEVMEFIFSNCKQRDALLTWIVIQLGADFDCRILTHEVIVEYLKKRRIAGSSQVVDFVEATLPKFDQEVIWDKLFNYVKMQRRLIPQPYDGIPNPEPTTFDSTNFNERYQDLSGKDHMEPLFKELELLKKLKKMKPGDVEESQCFRDAAPETKDEEEENVDAEKPEETSVVEKDTETPSDLKNTNNPKTNLGEGDAHKDQKPLATEVTNSGTWYCSPNGRQKVFVPIGAPPLGELNFDPKTMKVVVEEDKPKKESTYDGTKQLEDLEKMFKKMMKENNSGS